MNIIEKARQEGDEKVVNGKTYVYSRTKNNTFTWRVKKDKSGKQPDESGADKKSSSSGSPDFSNMSHDELVDWARKTIAGTLVNTVNKVDAKTEHRQIAYDELKDRGEDLSKLNTTGLKTDDSDTKQTSSDNQDTTDNSKKDDVKSDSKQDETRSDSSQDNKKTQKKEYTFKNKKPEVDISFNKFDVESLRDGSVTTFTYKNRKDLYNTYDDKKLLNIVNATGLNPHLRHIAYELASERGFNENDIDTSGTLQEFWDQQKAIKEGTDTTKQEIEDDDLQYISYNHGLKNFDVDKFMEEFPEGDYGWMDANDNRVKKAFNGLKTMKDRQDYDNFLDYQKRKQPDYANPDLQQKRMRKAYFGFANPDSQSSMLVCSGGAGVGKTYSLRRVFDMYVGMKEHDGEKAKELEDKGEKYNDYDYIFASEVNTVPQLAKFLGEHNGKMIVFDDNDSLLTNPDMANVMKTLTQENPKERFFPEYVDGKKTGKNSVFKGKIVILTNKTDDILNKNPDAVAVMSRAESVGINFTVNENLEALKDRYETMKISVKPSWSQEEDKKLRKEIYDYIVKNKDKLDPAKFTVRKFIQLYKHVAREKLSEQASSKSASAQEDLGYEDWKKSALAILNKAENSDSLYKYDLSHYDPEQAVENDDTLSEEEKKKLIKMMNKIDKEKPEDDDWGDDDEEDEKEEDAKEEKDDVKKAMNTLFSDMSLDEAENLLLK